MARFSLVVAAEAADGSGHLHQERPARRRGVARRPPPHQRPAPPRQRRIPTGQVRVLPSFYIFFITDFRCNICVVHLSCRSNTEAMEALRRAVHQEGPKPGHITLTIARKVRVIAFPATKNPSKFETLNCCFDEGRVLLVRRVLFGRRVLIVRRALRLRRVLLVGRVLQDGRDQSESTLGSLVGVRVFDQSPIVPFVCFVCVCVCVCVAGSSDPALERGPISGRGQQHHHPHRRRFFQPVRFYRVQVAT